MAKRFGGVSFSVCLLLVLFAGLASSADPPATSPPSPAPLLPPENSPTSAPSSSPNGAPVASPPSPPPESPAPASSPSADSPSPPFDENSPTPASAPSPDDSDVSDINHRGVDADGDAEEKSSGGSGAKTAGIVAGVVVAVCLVGLGAFVYKKRQDNIRRSQYSYATRRDIL